MSLPVRYVPPEPFEALPDPLYKLSPQERLFVLYYVGDARFNAGRAAEMARYGGSNPNTFRSIGYRVINVPRVREAINLLLDAEGASAAESIARTTRRARSTIADLFVIGPDGQPRLDLAHAERTGGIDSIKSITIKQSRTGGSIQIETHDAARADELLLRVRGKLRDTADYLTQGQAEDEREKLLDVITRHVNDKTILQAIAADISRLSRGVRDGTGESPAGDGGSNEPTEGPAVGPVDTDEGE